jgi:hypothetical protein
MSTNMPTNTAGGARRRALTRAVPVDEQTVSDRAGIGSGSPRVVTNVAGLRQAWYAEANRLILLVVEKGSVTSGKRESI